MQSMACVGEGEEGIRGVAADEVVSVVVRIAKVTLDDLGGDPAHIRINQIEVLARQAVQPITRRRVDLGKGRRFDDVTIQQSQGREDAAELTVVGPKSQRHV